MAQVAVLLAETPFDSRLTGSKMGIRFYCPNGHRLHVKSFLAGKRGICPHCSSRFRIPADSEIPRGSPKIQPNSRAAAKASADKRAKPDRAPSAAVKSSSEATSLSKGIAGAVGNGTDPIGEAPEAVWYVRPPSGGQYGPAKGDVMRKWISEGRVSADSLIWREGWADWLTAGPVFPELNTSYTASATTTPKREAVSLQLQPATTVAAGGNRSAAAIARPAARQKSIAAVIILVLIVLVLLAVLVFVLTSKS